MSFASCFSTFLLGSRGYDLLLQCLYLPVTSISESMWFTCPCSHPSCWCTHFTHPIQYISTIVCCLSCNQPLGIWVSKKYISQNMLCGRVCDSFIRCCTWISGSIGLSSVCISLELWDPILIIFFIIKCILINYILSPTCKFTVPGTNWSTPILLCRTYL